VPADPLLEVEDVGYAFGGVKAVDGCTFSIAAGEVNGLIGPNGAGKSTLINLISGTQRPQHGQVRFLGQSITGWTAHRVAQHGLIRTFQLSREFAGLTVLENLLAVAPRQAGEGLLTALFNSRRCRREDERLLEKAREVLQTFALYELRNEYARTLSGGQKRLLELARAVMAEPKLLLLDEPMAGVNPALLTRLVDHIGALRASGITFLMVEHNLNLVEQLCDHVVVMAAGRVLASGGMAELRANEDVVRAYLGGALVERVGG
jgi:ABC-type branched-subunit amino acid transport system ATPase component